MRLHARRAVGKALQPLSVRRRLTKRPLTQLQRGRPSFLSGIAYSRERRHLVWIVSLTRPAKYLSNMFSRLLPHLNHVPMGVALRGASPRQSSAFRAVRICTRSAKGAKRCHAKLFALHLIKVLSCACAAHASCKLSFARRDNRDLRRICGVRYGGATRAVTGTRLPIIP